MNRIDLLRKNYKRFLETSWDRNVSGAQRVWLVVYDKEDERKLRLRLPLFEEETVFRGRKWQTLDLTQSFAEWMCSTANAAFSESYFASPELLDSAVLSGFQDELIARIQMVLSEVKDPENTVLALYGVGSLFGFLRISEILPRVEGAIQGRLLVFFPGVYENYNYRLLDARDGWNYLAYPITASDLETRP